MESQENLCLRWNDFEKNISSSFKDLLEEDELYDITLACDDNQVKAHKVILSACCGFFKQVLRGKSQQHPLIYLRGVKYKDLLYLLDFMYLGQVSVAQDDLASFLAVAEDLKVKGLTQMNSNEPAAGNDIKKWEQPLKAPTNPPAKKPRLVSPPQDDDIQEIFKTEMNNSYDISDYPVASIDKNQCIPSSKESIGFEEDEFYGEEYCQSDGSNENIETGNRALNRKDAVRSRMVVVQGDDGKCQYACTECGHSGSHTTVKNHVEAKHLPQGQYHCPYCGKVCGTKNNFNVHISTKHHNARRTQLP